MRKPAFCICENKDADQLRGNPEADQRLCFRYTDSTIPLLSKSEISSIWRSSVAAQPSLCRTWSKIPKTGFLTTRLIYQALYFRDKVINLWHHHSVTAMTVAIAHKGKHLSLVLRKPVFRVSDQVRHKPGCTTTQDS